MKDKRVIAGIILFSIFMIEIFSLAYSENLQDKQIEETEKQNDSRHKQTNRKQIRKPAKFIPSEKINADSSVSFPVDI